MRPGPAPAIVDGASPFTTPGTRLTWGTGAAWVDAFNAIERRRHSSKRHVDLQAHLDELARHPDFLWALPLEELESMLQVVRRHYRPVQGSRKGTSYERVLNELLNVIASSRRPAPRVLMVASDAEGKTQRILRTLTSEGRIVE